MMSLARWCQFSVTCPKLPGELGPNAWHAPSARLLQPTLRNPGVICSCCQKPCSGPLPVLGHNIVSKLHSLHYDAATDGWRANAMSFGNLPPAAGGHQQRTFVTRMLHKHTWKLNKLVAVCWRQRVSCPVPVLLSLRPRSLTPAGALLRSCKPSTLKPALLARLCCPWALPLKLLCRSSLWLMWCGPPAGSAAVVLQVPPAFVAITSVKPLRRRTRMRWLYI